MTAHFRNVWTQVNGCRLYARVAPAAKPAVVCVHGLGVSGSYFMPAAKRLAAEFGVYVPDLPGHGRSGTPPRSLDVPGLADALLVWMDAVGLSRAHFIANSMGCQIVADIAGRCPERAERLVLVGPTADREGRTAAEHVRRFIIDIPHERVALAAIVAADYLRMGPRFFSEFRAMLRDHIEDKLPRIAAAALVVRGGNDPIAPPRWADEVARLLRAGHVAVIPAAGHAVHFSAPQRFADIVAPFLRGEALEVAAAACENRPQGC